MDKHLLRVAMGKEPADLVITNGQLVNVYSGEIYPGGVAVAGDKIAAAGDVEYAIGEGDPGHRRRRQVHHTRVHRRPHSPRKRQPEHEPFCRGGAVPTARPASSPTCTKSAWWAAWTP